MTTSQLGQQNLVRGALLAIITVFIGSTVAAAGKHLSSQVHIATIVLAQYSICFLLTLPTALRQGRRGLITTRPGLHSARALSGLACFYTYYLALHHIPLVDAALLRNSAPLLVPLVILLWLGQAIAPCRWPAMLLGFGGIVLILRPGADGISGWHLVGLSSGAGLAISMVSTRLLAHSEPEERILFYYFAIALVVILPFYALHAEPIPPAAWPWLIYIGVAMYLTFLLYTRAYRYATASVLAPVSYFSVAFAGLLDWAIWAHLPGPMALAGTALVVAGGVLVLRSRAQEGET